MAWCEGHFTFLDLTLQTFCLITCTSWRYFRKLWTVSRSHRGAILIYAFDCDWIWVSNKLLVWCEGHCTIWRNRVGSLTWNSLLLASICESWLYCFIDWNQWIATLEGWSTCLRNTLRACAGCTGSCRSHLSKLWTVSRSNWGPVLINSFNCYWIWSPKVFLIRRKGNRSIWIDAIFTYTWNCLR
ncbi:hypothetical protein D8850_06960 [Streptococcus oralis]|nr:hypothetical protein D8864_09350 [Streptococcus oralis]RSK13207.1 hypothetical protein D8850_06960 [Streptococcus oralis]